MGEGKPSAGPFWLFPFNRILVHPSRRNCDFTALLQLYRNAKDENRATSCRSTLFFVQKQLS